MIVLMHRRLIDVIHGSIYQSVVVMMSYLGWSLWSADRWPLSNLTSTQTMNGDLAPFHCLVTLVMILTTVEVVISSLG